MGEIFFIPDGVLCGVFVTMDVTTGNIQIYYIGKYYENTME